MDSYEEKDGIYYVDYMRHFAHMLDEAPETRGFSKLKDDTQQVKFVLNVLKKMDASLDVKKCEKKDNKKSVEFRKEGNRMYASKCSKDFGRTIAEEYTKSIAYAQPGSEQLAMAYANRSALFFTNQFYNECLLDIERALQNDYPDEMKAKLYARRVRCFASMGDKSSPQLEETVKDTRKWLLKMDAKTSGRDIVEKTLTDKNHMASAPLYVEPKEEKIKVEVPTDNPSIVGASSAVQISYSKQWGRHVTATRDIRPGEVLAVQKMYCSALAPEGTYRYCAHCQADAISAVPCDHCVNAIYCSTACRDEAWLDYHEFECPVLSPMIAVGCYPVDFLKLRVTIKAVKEAGGLPELKSLIKALNSGSDPKYKGFTKGVYDGTKYAAFGTAFTLDQRLFDSQKEFLTSTESVCMAYMLATQTKFFGRKFSNFLYIFEQSKDILFVAELIKRHHVLLEANFIGQQLPGKVKVHGIAPFSSLFNHSCQTSITTVYKTKIIIYSLKFIEKGEQIFDCYGSLQYATAMKELRQAIFQKQYQFNCNCIPCQEDWPMFYRLPKLSDLSEKQVDRNAARLIKSTLWDCEQLMKKDLTDKENIELSKRVIDLIELLCKHVRGPCLEKYQAQGWLRACYNDVIEQL